MIRSGWVTGIVVLAGIGLLVFSGWRFLQSRDPQLCTVCERPVHGNTRTEAVVGGAARPYCCPACALSEHTQSGLPVEVLKLTDFDSGRPLEPRDAFVVRGSDVRSCSHEANPMNEEKRTLRPTYDRCSPSMLAFASHEAAGKFSRVHGGEVIAFSALSPLYR